jgi:hypothetical protein
VPGSRVIEIGEICEKKEKILHWAVYNDATFVWVTPNNNRREHHAKQSRDRGFSFLRPYKVPGDYGAVLRAAGVLTHQASQQLETLRRLEDEDDARNQRTQNERVQSGDIYHCG